MISGASEQELELANARANIVMKLDNTSTYESWLIIDTYLEQLEKENQELKKQLETINKKYRFESKYRDKNYKLLRKKDTQQKEFIKHLEEKIKNINKTESHLYQNKIPKYFELGIVKGEKYATKEILQRFKEITGTTNEQN